MKREYAYGTWLETVPPWSQYIRGRAMCSDGVVRNLKRIAPVADTWFSVRAAVTVRGKTVTGFVSVETADGHDTQTDDDPGVVKFIAHKYGRNGELLPGLGWKREQEGSTK